jgi:hypothetical protein
MKNHVRVNGQLLQTNKTWRDLFMRDVYVKIFLENYLQDLENQVNDFLGELYNERGELVDIKYQSTGFPIEQERDYNYTAIVLYKG